MSYRQRKMDADENASTQICSSGRVSWMPMKMQGHICNADRAKWMQMKTQAPRFTIQAERMEMDADENSGTQICNAGRAKWMQMEVQTLGFSMLAEAIGCRWKCRHTRL